MKSLSDFKPYEVMYVDAMNLLARSFHGMSELEYHGKRTGMLYGVSRLFIEWKKKAPNIEIIMIWEGKDSWRKAKYPIYKAQRGDKSSEDREVFWECVERVKAALPAMGIGQCWCHTFEADDVVVALAKQEKRKALFSSGDWDWWELADYGDILYQHKDVLTPDDMDAMFEKKFKAFPVDPDKLWLFKVLTGDPSDNVSGVPRFPKKLASQLCRVAGVDEGNIIHGLISMGEDKWAQKVADNMWIVKRNLELLRSSDVPFEDIEWVAGKFSKKKVVDILLKSGMDHLHDRFTEVFGGNNTTR
jgi:DNA polymerase-1